MVLAITHDDAFEAYMAPAFPAECVGSTYVEPQKSWGTCCCGDARPALAYQRGPALRAQAEKQCDAMERTAAVRCEAFRFDRLGDRLLGRVVVDTETTRHVVHRNPIADRRTLPPVRRSVPRRPRKSGRSGRAVACA
jgi:hypothetical protein